MNLANVRSEFAIYDNNPELAYLDSASTTLVPRDAVRASADFMNTITVSSRKGAHRLATKGAALVESTRRTLAGYLDTEPSQVSFQKSISSAVASLAYGYPWKEEERNRLAIARSEENSVLVALLRVAKVLNLAVDIITTDSEGMLDFAELDKLVNEKTGIVAVGHVSPGIGTINPVKEISGLAHEMGAILLTDATRSVGLTESSIVGLGSDVLLFSGNIGLMGPPGLAIQWMDSGLGTAHEPGILGGASVSSVTNSEYEIALPPDKFESGMLNVPAIAGFNVSLGLLQGLGSLSSDLRDLSGYMARRLANVKELVLYGSPNESRTIFGFNLGSDGDLNCHDIALFLDESQIAVRSGLICAHPLVQSITQDGLVQASLHVYNTHEDIDRLCDALETIATDFL
jgi:cysteine desulfurase/selenocysteine lyase